MIGKRIKQLRKALKMTQPKFGASVGADTKTVLRWEKEAHDPAEKNLREICLIHHVNRPWLETGEGEPFEPGWEPDGSLRKAARKQTDRALTIADGTSIYLTGTESTEQEQEIIRMLLHVLRGRWEGGYETSLEQNVRSFYHACMVEEETQLPPTANDFKTKARNHSSGGGGSKG